MTARQKPYKVTRRATRPQECPESYATPPSRIFTPLRVIAARAPSGGEIRLIKWQESKHPSVSWYQGKLTVAEDDQFWKAKLLAEKAGDDKWNAASALLVAHGWEVS
jgi:hypothetical protein